MRIGSGVIAVWAATCVLPAVAGAQARSLTLAEVLALARERAPHVVSARLAMGEARARLAGASIRLQAPELEAAIGNRAGPERRYTDLEVGIAQSVEPSSRRAARMAGAAAAVEQSAANADETVRVALRAAARAYFQALHAQERIRLLDTSRELAAGVYSVADRRYQAGDIAVLDVNIARGSLARARAGVEAAEALRSLALAELTQLLQIDGGVQVEGTLAPAAVAELPALLAAARQRPDLAALEAAIREAEAEARTGRTYERPAYGVGVRYSREEGDQIVLGGLTVTLPMFSTGQELQAAGLARAARLRAELDAASGRVEIEVRSAYEAYLRRLAALRVLEAEAIPALDENERLAARSFDVGQLGLPELLLVRREILDTRAEYLDALLEAALARIEVDASAGILR